MATYWNGLKAWNRLQGLAFHTVADILLAYIAARDTWNSAAINAGNSFFSNILPHSSLEGQLLLRKGISTKFWTYGGERSDWPPDLRWKQSAHAGFGSLPLLTAQQLLTWAYRHCPTADKAANLVMMGYSLFQLDKNISWIYKKQQRHRLHKTL